MTQIITNGRDHIAQIDNPPARYRVSIYGEDTWYASGSDAVDAICAAGMDLTGSGSQYWSLYDESAQRFVSVTDAMCGFPRMQSPTLR